MNEWILGDGRTADERVLKWVTGKRKRFWYMMTVLNHGKMDDNDAWTDVCFMIVFDKCWSTSDIGLWPFNYGRGAVRYGLRIMDNVLWMISAGRRSHKHACIMFDGGRAAVADWWHISYDVCKWRLLVYGCWTIYCGQSNWAIASVSRIMDKCRWATDDGCMRSLWMMSGGMLRGRKHVWGLDGCIYIMDGRIKVGWTDGGYTDWMRMNGCTKYCCNANMR